jgi:glycerophosphoryl diester phosphodiesterase
VSADNQVVVSHEPWLNPQICLDPDGRALGADDVRNLNLYCLPYSEIRRCDCGQRRHALFPEQVSEPAYKPLLRETLAVIDAAARQLGRPPVGFSIEIKSTPEGDNIFHPEPAKFLDLVLAELKAAQVLARTTLLCFDARILRLAHGRMPELATCLLVEDEQPWLISIEKLGFIPTTFGPDFTTVSQEAVRELRTSFPDLRLVPWTVNELPDMQRLREFGMDGMTTDYPDRLLAFLAHERV